MSRDREMEFKVDEDMQRILEFMQQNIPTCKLVAISEKMPEMGRLLWGHYEQEPVLPLILNPPAISISCVTQPSATESGPEQ